MSPRLLVHFRSRAYVIAKDVECRSDIKGQSQSLWSPQKKSLGIQFFPVAVAYDDELCLGGSLHEWKIDVFETRDFICHV